MSAKVQCFGEKRSDMILQPCFFPPMSEHALFSSSFGVKQLCGEIHLRPLTWSSYPVYGEAYWLICVALLVISTESEYFPAVLLASGLILLMWSRTCLIPASTLVAFYLLSPLINCNLFIQISIKTVVYEREHGYVDTLRCTKLAFKHACMFLCEYKPKSVTSKHLYL